MAPKLQQDFLLLFQCIIDFGADVLRDCTKVKMKSIYQTDNFKTFLGKTKHHFFHQLQKQNLICCACAITGCKIQKTGYMDRKIFDKFYFYDKTLRSPPGHHVSNGKTFPQTCICRFVENNKVLDDLDLSDLNSLLRSLSIMPQPEESLLKELMEVRGKICHSVTTNTFSQHELTNLWTIFMNAVCKLCPSDPKYLKKAIELTKSSVMSDEMLFDLIGKVQQIITDCNEIKPVIMEYKEKLDVIEIQQNEHTARLERLESLLMGKLKATENNTQAIIYIYDSEKANTTVGTSSEKQVDKCIECEANCPNLDEDKALKRLAAKTEVTSSKKLKIESVEKHCLLLKLSSRPEVFESEEILHSAIMSLVQQIADAGDLDTSVNSNMDIKITFTSPLTVDERNIIVSMLVTYGTINEGYTTKATEKDEGIGDIDSNAMDYSDNSRHEKNTIFNQDEFMTKLENPFYTIKKEDMKKIPMNLQDNCFKKEANETESLDFQLRTVKTEATERQVDEMLVLIGGITCLWRIKGLTNRLQHLDDNQDISIDEGKQVWYLQWRLECPEDWNISSVVEKMNTNKRLLHGYFNIDFVHSGMQREIVIETNTKKRVFNSYVSAELAFKTFLDQIVKVCDLQTTEPFDMSVTTSVLAVIEQSENEMENESLMEDNDIVCEHCKNVTKCYKCTEKVKLIMELTFSRNMNDTLLERLSENMKMTKKEMLEVLEQAKVASTSNIEPIEIMEISKGKISGKNVQYLAQLGSDETSSTLNTDVSDINEEIAFEHATHAEHSIADKDKDTSSAANIPTSLESGDGELIYRCKICFSFFDSVEHRKEHLKTHFRCNLCEKGFTSSSYLRKHTMTQHYRLKPHKCPICGKGYASLSDFAVHVTSHTGVKQYVCMTCGHVFTSLVCLRVHSRTHK